MSVFSGNFRKVLQGALGQAKEVVVTDGLRPLLAGVMRYQSHLETTGGQADDFIGALTADSSLIHDVFVENSVVDYDILDPQGMHPTQISDGMADTVVGGLREACHNGDLESETKALTVTDTEGHFYNFIDVTDDDIIIDGCQVIIATKESPSRLTETLVYQDSDGHYHLNNMVMTGDFHADVDPSLCTGQVVPLWQVVKSGLESIALNDTIKNTCAAITSSSGSLESAVNTVHNECLASKYDSVRKFGANLSSSYSVAGVTGAASMVLNYARNATQFTQSGDVFTLTDNSKLIPKAFLSGFITGVFTVVGTILAVIGNIFVKILGVAISLVSTVIKKISDAKSSATYAHLDSDNVYALPLAPFGVSQLTITNSNFLEQNEDFASLIAQQKYLIQFEIPGGTVFFGPTAFNASEEPTEYGIEFHPSFANSQSAADEIVNWCIEDGLIYGVLKDYGSSTVRARLVLDVSLEQRGEYLQGVIMDRWNTYLRSSTYNNSSTGALSSSNDKAIRKNVLRNMTIGLLWLSSFSGDVTTNLFNAGDATNREFYLGLSTSGSWGTYDYFQCNYSAADPWHYPSIWPLLIWFFGNKDYKIWCTDSQSHSVGVYIRRANGSTVRNPDDVSWADMVSKAVAGSSLTTANMYSCYANLLYELGYYGTLTTFSTALTFQLVLPNYDAKSFWANVVVAALLTAIITGVAIAATFMIRRAIIQKRSINEAAVGHAYQNLQDDPSAENYAAYRKAVKKNNRWALLIGGSKFDTTSYWNGAVNASDPGQTSGETGNPFSVSGLLGDSSDRDNLVDLSAASEASSDAKIFEIKRLISTF